MHAPLPPEALLAPSSNHGKESRPHALPPTIDLRHCQLTFASIDRLTLQREGDVGQVVTLRMRLAPDALVSFLTRAIAGGPVSNLTFRPQSRHEFALGASAFHFPLQAEVGLTARAGRVLLTMDSAQAGWLPLPCHWLRDQILASSDPALLRTKAVQAAGDRGLSFSPDYLFSHVVAGFGRDLQQHGLPPHLRVYLRRVAVVDGQILVEGGT